MSAGTGPYDEPTPTTDDDPTNDGPYTNWTNGFEPSDDEATDESNPPSAWHDQADSNSTGGGWARIWPPD